MPHLLDALAAHALRVARMVTAFPDRHLNHDGLLHELVLDWDAIRPTLAR